jgi:hypothetical protein
MEKEPFVIPAAVVSAISALLLFYGWSTQEEIAVWVATIAAVGPIAAALVGRLYAFSRNTVRKAGFTPKELEARADSKAVLPAPPKESPLNDVVRTGVVLMGTGDGS